MLVAPTRRVGEPVARLACKTLNWTDALCPGMSDEDATGAREDEAPDGEDRETTTDDEAAPEQVDGGDDESEDDRPAAAPDRLVTRIADHDEALAEDVRRLVERDAGLREAADHLETALDERDGEVADLRERVHRFESELAEREAEIEELESELTERETEVEDLTDRLRRTRADYENYKKRAERKRERVKERATEDLIERLLDVRDNLRRATEEDDPDAERLLDGVEMTLREFDRVLDDEGVTEIAPMPGDEIDPARHEVMMRADSDQPADTVADVYAPGYEMAGEVIRPARVTVSTGPADDGDASEEADAARTEE
jgi:molecular chaperone GrpE